MDLEDVGPPKIPLLTFAVPEASQGDVANNIDDHNHNMELKPVSMTRINSTNLSRPDTTTSNVSGSDTPDNASTLSRDAASTLCRDAQAQPRGSPAMARHAPTLPQDNNSPVMSWHAGFQPHYVDGVIAGVKAGDHIKMTETVSRLGTEGFAAIIREHDGKNNGPLHYAAFNKDVLMTKLLLQYGGDVNDVGEGGKRPLHFAAMRRAQDRVTTMQDSVDGDLDLPYPESMASQLSEGTNTSNTTDQSEESPLNIGSSLLGFLSGKDSKDRKEKKKKKRRLLSEASLKMGDDDKPTVSALALASTRSLGPPPKEEDEANDEEKDDAKEDGNANVDENIIDVLITAGAVASAKDTKGLTPLHIALMQANMNAFKCLLAHSTVDIDVRDRRGATPLFYACKTGNTDGALVLLNKGADIFIADVNGDTPLHVAVRHSHTTMVMALIDVAENKGCIAKVMLDENTRGVIAMYDAVRCDHKDLFQLCLNHEKISELDMDKLINFASRDNDDTLLHVAASAGDQDIVEALISNHADVNRVNFGRQTPLHLACAKNHEGIALALVESGGDVNIVDSAGLNPLQVAVIHGSFETLMTLLQYTSAASGGQCDEATHILEWSAKHNKADILRKILDYEFRFHEMTDGEIMDFIMDAVKSKHKEMVNVLVRWNRAVVDHRDKFGNTPLHHAAEGGHQEIAYELIQAKAKVNAKNGDDLGGLSPLHYVAARGWPRTARVLLDSHANIDQMDDQMMTPLHHACRQGKLGMVDLLLYGKGAGSVSEPADITIRDADGLNCLDYAIDNGHETIARMIVKHFRWKDVLSVSSQDDETKYRSTPLRKLIRFMPDVAKLVLDRCITVTGGSCVRDKDVRIEFYYELLEDAFSPWMKKKDELPTPTTGALNTFLNRMYRRVSTRLPSDIEDQYDRNDHLLKSAQPFITDPHERNDNHPLQLMVSSKCVDLLDHPLVKTFVQNKWKSSSRYIFYLGFIIYLTFLGMLTGYIVVIPPNYYIRTVEHNGSDSSIVWFGDGEHRWVNAVPNSVIIAFDVFGPTAIIFLSVLNIGREFAQMFVQRLSYFRDWGNIMELVLYTSTILFSLPFSRVEYVSNGTIKQFWQWPIGAAAGFMGWINLLLFIRSNSNLGIYVIMFIDIFKTFFRFSLILFLFVMAFGLAFYALLMNQNPFNSLFDSLSKTFVMMIGELDYANIFFGQDYLGTSNTLEGDGPDAFFMNSNFYGKLTQVFFILFLIVMSILMMNMLVGLAVGDIQAIQDKANLHRLTMQADMILQNQSKFPLWAWRRSVVRRKSFLLNETKLKKWLRRLTGGRKQLKRALQISIEAESPLTITDCANDEALEKLRLRLKELSMKMERATADMLEATGKKDTQLDQIRDTQNDLFDRTDHLQSTQDRLGDRVEVMHRKLDFIAKKLKIKPKKSEYLF